MDDVEIYNDWCEYNNNNLPISFAEFCYKQGKADTMEELKSKADCKNSDCYACAMADGNMNCMLGLLELDED